jgi:hypothetical protein
MGPQSQTAAWEFLVLEQPKRLTVMSKIRKNNRKRFVYENLEGRRLLAADLMTGGAIDAQPLEPAIVSCCVDSLEASEISEEILEATEVTIATSENVVDEASTESEVQTEPSAGDARSFDLTDGMDGYFGEINAENPTETLEFTASADGMIDVVVASSFGDSQTQLTITDSSGMVMESSVDGLESFNVISFQANEGETYLATIGSNDTQTEGQFQVTVGFEEFVDQHADAMGEDSTEISLVDNQAELEGRLESATDSDTFRFTADESGEARLSLSETVADARVGLDISVFDAEANLIIDGATNESLEISLDVEAGGEYFVAVSSSDGEKGTYKVGLDITPSEVITSDASPETDQAQSDPLPSDAVADPVDDVIDTAVDSTVTDVDSDSPNLASELSPDAEAEVVDATDIANEADPVNQEAVEVEVGVVDGAIEVEVILDVDVIVDVNDESTTSETVEETAASEVTTDVDAEDSPPIEEAIDGDVVDLASNVDGIVNDALDANGLPVELAIEMDGETAPIDGVIENIDSIVDFDELEESMIECEFELDNLDEAFAELVAEGAGDLLSNSFDQARSRLGGIRGLDFLRF